MMRLAQSVCFGIGCLVAQTRLSIAALRTPNKADINLSEVDRLSIEDIDELMQKLYAGFSHMNTRPPDEERYRTFQQGFSTGLSQGPLASEWATSIHPRIRRYSQQVQQKRDQFWDLGSGEGHALLKAFLTGDHDIAKVWIGVERDSDRHATSVEVLHRLQTAASEPTKIGRILQQRLGLSHNGEPNGNSLGYDAQPTVTGSKYCIGDPFHEQICMVCADFNSIKDFSRSDVVFVNIDDNEGLVLNKLVGGPLQYTLPTSAILMTSYALRGTVRSTWQADELYIPIEQDWDDVNRSVWPYHCIYHRKSQTLG